MLSARLARVKDRTRDGLWTRAPAACYAACVDARSRTTLLIATLAALLSAEALAAPIPGRLELAELSRLRAYSLSRVDAIGPSLEVAAGMDAAIGFSGARCAKDGFAYRALRTGRVVVELEIPQLASRLVVVMRSVGGARDLQALIGDKSLGPAQTIRTDGFTRAVFPLELPLRGARRQIVLEVSGPLQPGVGGADKPTATRAELHAIYTSEHELETKPSQAADPAAEAGVLWLEAGESADLTVELDAATANLALQTDGTQLRGSTSGAFIEVELTDPPGAELLKHRLPADLAIPWNLSLGIPQRGMARLKLRFDGPPGSAVGLERPRLTVPGLPPPPPATDAERPVYLIAVRGLSAADAERVQAAVGEVVPGARQLQSAWTTAPDARLALASLVTGRYPAALGLGKVGDRLRGNYPTLATVADAAGRRAVLGSDLSLGGSVDPTWRGFTHRTFGDDPGRSPHAADILAAVYESTRYGALTKVFAFALIGGPAPPYLPRTEAWKRYFDGVPPWKPLETRKILGQERRFSTAELDYLRALRAGGAQEALEAVRDFLRPLLERPGPKPIVVVLGLGAEPLTGGWPTAAGPLESRIPVWVLGAPLEASTLADTVDLTDLATWLGQLVGEGLPSAAAQSAGLLPRAGWPSLAWTRAPGHADLIVAGEWALEARQGQEPRVWRRRGVAWEAPKAEVVGLDLRTRALERVLRAMSAAPKAYRELRDAPYGFIGVGPQAGPCD